MAEKLRLEWRSVSTAAVLQYGLAALPCGLAAALPCGSVAALRCALASAPQSPSPSWPDWG